MGRLYGSIQEADATTGVFTGARGRQQSQSARRRSDRRSRGEGDLFEEAAVLTLKMRTKPRGGTRL